MRALRLTENVSAAREASPRLEEITSRPVSRVLSGGFPPRRPFVWDAHCWTPRATNPGGGSGNGLGSRSFERSRPPLFGLAPGGVCPAADVAAGAVRSYRTLSPLPGSAEAWPGGLLSVALSLGSPPAAVSRHRVSMEPGLSSTELALMGHKRPQSRQRPSGRLVEAIRARVALTSSDIATAGYMT